MKDKGPGDIMWEVIETRMTPPVEGKIDKAWLELDRAYKAIAPMTDKPVKIGSISAQILALMLTDQHYNDRLQLLVRYVGGAQPRIPRAGRRRRADRAGRGAGDPSGDRGPATRRSSRTNGSRHSIAEVKGLRGKCEVWCHTCWGSPAAQRVASRDQSYKNALPYFDQLDVDVITFEGAFNRGMDLEAIGKGISKDKKIALGVISHRTLQVERPEEIADLIRLALKWIEPERLMLSSDCGFGRQSMSRMHAFYKMVALSARRQHRAQGARICRRPTSPPPIRSCRWCRSAVDGRGLFHVPRSVIGQSADRHFLSARHNRRQRMAQDADFFSGGIEMNIKVGRKAIEEASKKLSNWGRWGKDDHIGTLNHVTPGGHRQRRQA